MAEDQSLISWVVFHWRLFTQHFFWATWSIDDKKCSWNQMFSPLKLLQDLEVAGHMNLSFWTLQKRVTQSLTGRRRPDCRLGKTIFKYIFLMLAPAELVLTKKMVFCGQRYAPHVRSVEFWCSVLFCYFLICLRTLQKLSLPTIQNIVFKTYFSIDTNFKTKKLRQPF